MCSSISRFSGDQNGSFSSMSWFTGDQNGSFSNISRFTGTQNGSFSSISRIPGFHSEQISIIIDFGIESYDDNKNMTLQIVVSYVFL